MTKYNILREFRKWQVRTRAYGCINKEVKKFIYNVMDLSGFPSAEKKIKALKKELIKKKYWNVKLNKWTSKAK